MFSFRRFVSVFFSNLTDLTHLQVYRGELSGIPVAVKLISIPYQKNNDIFDDPEIQWMQRARHPRLVLFFGAGRASDGRLFYVMELMKEGTLTEAFLKSKECESSLSWCERLSLLTDVASGMQYLHCIMGSIHRDLKGQNVLLCLEKGKRRAKVADFGLSRIVDRGRHSRAVSKTMTPRRKKRSNAASSSVSSASLDVDAISTKFDDSNDLQSLSSFFSGGSVSATESGASNSSSSILTPPPKKSTSSSSSPSSSCGMKFELSSAEGTIQYMAPELLSVFKNSGVEYTFKADVYAFGVMMWEVLSHEKAWSEFRWTHQIFMAVTSGQRLSLKIFPKDSIVPKGYQSLLEKCWSQQPDDRPTFTTVLNSLRDILVVKCRDKMKWDDDSDEENLEPTRTSSVAVRSDYVRLDE